MRTSRVKQEVCSKWEECASCSSNRISHSSRHQACPKMSQKEVNYRIVERAIGNFADTATRALIIDPYSLHLIPQPPALTTPPKPCLKIGASIKFSQSVTINEFWPEEITASLPLSTSSASYAAMTSASGFPCVTCSSRARQRVAASWTALLRPWPRSVWVRQIHSAHPRLLSVQDESQGRDDCSN